jgi:hypothetical protein
VERKKVKEMFDRFEEKNKLRKTFGSDSEESVTHEPKECAEGECEEDDDGLIDDGELMRV